MTNSPGSCPLKLDGEMLLPCSSILAKSIYTTIRPEFRVPTDLFLLYAHDHSTKIYGSLSFSLSFAHDHSTKIVVFFHLFFLLCTIIRPKNKVHTDLFLYMYTTIRPKIRVFINLFILFVNDHSTKN